MKKIGFYNFFLTSFVIFCFIATTSGYSNGANKTSGNKDQKKSTYEEFVDPGRDFRGAPFWAWNGKLEKDELLRQIGVFKAMGMGGFFMHSRTGLNTEYLGTDWMKLINLCADKAHKMGLEAWLYDEDRWPSGTAGGIVTKNPAYRAKYVSLYKMQGEQFSWNDSIIAAFTCNLNNLNFSGCHRINKNTPLSSLSGKTVLMFVQEEMAKSSFYNGYTDLNRLKKEATEKFISETHEKYKKSCGNRLGRSIYGIFSDEPNRGFVMTNFGNSNKNCLWMAPWTEELPGMFKSRYGYDLIDHLPDLFLKNNGHSVAQVKWQYMDLLEYMFLHNFLQPIHEWCQRNHMIYTGHLLHEDNLVAQAAPQGSLMRSYEFMDYPGVDVLTEGNRNYCIVKQLSSVARQLDKKRMLCELYGCTGWQMNFESYKAVGNWQALLGINFRCHHLSWYTMEGEAKRDYPASIFYQSGWWNDYSTVEDYFSRLNVVLSQGKPDCHLLVINPIESVWCQVGVGWANGLSAGTEPINKLETQYHDLYMWLLENRIDYDYGEEEMISRLYHIGKDGNGQPVLWIGKAPYKTVLVSEMTTIRRSTLKILNEFKKAGGTVIFAGDVAEYVNALPSKDANELANQSVCIPFEKNAIITACKEHLPAVVEAIDQKTGRSVDDVFCQVRNDKGKKYVVLMNVSTDKKYENVKVRIPGCGYVTEWNCQTAEKTAVNAENKNNTIEISTDFYPSEEHVYVITPEKEKGVLSGKALAVRDRVMLTGPFKYSLSEKNVCVLDLAKYKIDNGPEVEETEILKIDQAVREHFGLKLRGGEMIQPWYAHKFGNSSALKGKVQLQFDFNIKQLPQDTVYLCIERPENFAVSVNGKIVNSKVSGWYIDSSIKKLPIPLSFLKEGKNEVELNVDFSEDKNLEALYLVGDFGVQLEGAQRTITPLPADIAVGDIVSQGFPFYTGAITYKIPVTTKFGKEDQLFFTTPKFEAACVKVGCDFTQKVIAWQPYEANVTEMKGSKDQLLNVAVVLTRRNTFGPLHEVTLRAGAYGPGNFVTGGDDFSMNYALYPSGLLAIPYIEVRR